MPLIASILLASVAAVSVDRAAHSVTFTARATDVDAGTTVEFAFVGPDSDRAYEAMFVTDAPLLEIAKAFDEAGIPRGRAISASACRFWPVGNEIAIEPSISKFICDRAEKGGWGFPVVYTGGLRGKDDVPVANDTAPNALFALYALDQSLLLLDSTLDQSAQYGRFTCRRKLDPGERQVFKVSWNGSRQFATRKLALEPGKIREAIESLKTNDVRCVDVQPDFSADLTAREAKAAATALAVVDSPAVRINGFSEGQIYYRGFLPDDAWRDRTKRITQPLEVRVCSTNVAYTAIEEDWSVEGDDPKLTPHEFTAPEKLPGFFKGDSCLFFVKPDVKLRTVYEIMGKLPRSIRNWYVFVD